MPKASHLRYESPDDWLADRERSTHGLQPRHGTPVNEDAQPVEASIPDADQGAKGTPPGGRKKRSPDSWIMELTDLARNEHAGDSRHYDDLYGV